MPMDSSGFNRDAVCFELIEARSAIDDLIAELKLGKHDQVESLSSLAYLFQHIENHLCRAWHSKWMSLEDLRNVSRMDYDEMSDSIPNWGLSFKLVGMDEPRKFDRREMANGDAAR
jgi:hypothetical protein